jgi:hypothetical protein
MEVLNRNEETSYIGNISRHLFGLSLVFWQFCPLACPLDVMTTYYLCSSLVIPASFVVPFPTCLFGREREREQLHAEDNPLILL